MTQTISEKDIQEILCKRDLRKRLAEEDPTWFSLIYLRHHFEVPFAPFHHEMFHILRDEAFDFVVIMAFRGSGKSAILNTAGVLWSVLGKPKKKFAVIVGSTMDQAKSQFTNIKDELKFNDLLREDFGPFTDNERDWQKMSLELVYRDSKIISVSKEQSFRGMKYGTLRPDLIICDDLEDVSAGQDDIGRASLWFRFTSEIVPLGGTGTRIIFLGNLVCPDSIMMKLKRAIDDGQFPGIFRAYPLLDDDKKILWPEKFKSIDEVKKLSDKFTSPVWAREFLLKILGWHNGEDNDEIWARLSKEILNRKEDDISYQTALIDVMKDFRISVPIDVPRKSFFKIGEDRTYHRYYKNVDLDNELRSVKEDNEQFEAMIEIMEKELKEKMLNGYPKFEGESGGTRLDES